MQEKDTRNPALFEVTQKLLSHVEQQLVRTSTDYHWLNFALKNTLSPAFFLVFGLQELFRPLKTWGLLFVILLISVSVHSLSQVSFHGIQIEGTLNGAPCSLLAHQSTVQMLCFGEEITEDTSSRPIGFIWSGHNVQVCCH